LPSEVEHHRLQAHGTLSGAGRLRRRLVSR